MTRSLTSAPRLALFFTVLVSLSCAVQAADSPARAAPAANGQAVYEHWCAPCHAPGPGHPGTQSLQVKYAGKTSAVLLERTDLSPQAVAVFVRQGVLMMAPFRKTEISDADLTALAAYVARNFKAP
jgi:(+)-pinoresinol hydroxylase